MRGRKVWSRLGGCCVQEVVMQGAEVCLWPERDRSAESAILLA